MRRGHRLEGLRALLDDGNFDDHGVLKWIEHKDSVSGLQIGCVGEEKE